MPKTAKDDNPLSSADAKKHLEKGAFCHKVLNLIFTT